MATDSSDSEADTDEQLSSEDYYNLWEKERELRLVEEKQLKTLDEALHAASRTIMRQEDNYRKIKAKIDCRRLENSWLRLVLAALLEIMEAEVAQINQRREAAKKKFAFLMWKTERQCRRQIRRQITRNEVVLQSAVENITLMKALCNRTKHLTNELYKQNCRLRDVILLLILIMWLSFDRIFPAKII
ncbi:unnamed protein product [Caenorhabditis nigoni]